METRALPNRLCDLLLTLVIIITGAVMGTAMGAPRESRREQITKFVVQIQRADYQGDRPTLKRLYDDLAPFAEDEEFGARVRYWRGFALWRRALNGFNDKVDLNELKQDLKQAVSEFETATTRDPAFVDARASAGATLGTLMGLFTAKTRSLQRISRIRQACARP